MRQALRKKQPFGNARTSVIPAPVRGWRSDEGAAREQPGAALRLRNWICDPDAIRVRRGNKQHADGMEAEVETLMVYTSGTQSIMFAASGTQIYNVTPELAATSSLTGLTNARWTWTNFTTAGGQFLIIANGSDTVRQFDGTNWTAPAITGPTATSDLSVVWQHKQHLWFIEKNSMSAWYLPVNNIAGAATEFNIGALFNFGGKLIAGATWSVDAGDGMDDLNVFVTSEGEAAIYSMIDPGDPATLRNRGVYHLGRPIGPNCFYQFGGELLAITYKGIVPMSKAISIDADKLDAAAITGPIRADYAKAAKQYGAKAGWQIIAYSKSNILFLNIPLNELLTAKQFVVNPLTGAWSEWNSLNALCWAVFNEKLYFGAADGVVYEAETGSEDNGAAITAEVITSFSQLHAPARQKLIKLLRPNVDANVASRGTSMPVVDFKTPVLTDTSGDTASVSTARWDVARWDIDRWPGNAILSTWRGGGNVGTAIGVHFVIKATSDTPEDDLDYRLISWDCVHEVGGVL